MAELVPRDPALDPAIQLLEDPGGPALGSDPFAAEDSLNPFLEALEGLGRRPAPAPARPRADADEVRPRRPLRAPPTPERWSRTPRLEEIDETDPEGWTDRLLSPEQRRRLAALAHLVEGEAPYDRFGFQPDVARRAFPFFAAIHRHYFRTESVGAENIPTAGPAVMVANHGGLLPFDAAMWVVDVLLETDPPRLLRAVVDKWAGTLPFVNIFYARVGQVIGTRENFADLLADGQLVGVFPEGMDGMRKPVAQRYRVQRFRTGFVELALRSRAPIVPTAIVGSDDQQPILHDFRGLARRLGLPLLPVTPTFPWLGPLGLLPLPVRYKIVYGEPLPVHERFSPEDANDSRLVNYLTRQVRRSVQQLLDRHR